MRFCFIVEEKFRQQPLTIAISDLLEQWKHEVIMLEPEATITSLTDLSFQSYDACLLKAAYTGAAAAMAEAAEAEGVPVINNTRSLQLVSEPAVAMAYARARGLPVFTSYLLNGTAALHQLSEDTFPLFLTPNNQPHEEYNHHIVLSASEAAQLELPSHTTYLATRYPIQQQKRLQLFITGQTVHATCTILEEEHVIEQEEVVSPHMLKLAQKVSQIFGLEIYSLETIETPEGLYLLGIQPFPDFTGIPGKVAEIAEYLLHIAYSRQLQLEKQAGKARGNLKAATRHNPVLVAAQLMQDNGSVKRVHMNQ